MTDDKGIRLNDDQVKRRKQRSKAIAWCLVALVILFYVITVLKLGPGILDRAL